MSIVALSHSAQGSVSVMITGYIWYDATRELSSYSRADDDIFATLLFGSKDPAPISGYISEDPQQDVDF